MREDAWAARPGDVIRSRDRAWVVLDVREADPTMVPSSWPERFVEGARALVVRPVRPVGRREEDPERTWRVFAPRCRPLSWVREHHLDLLARADDEGRFAECSVCGLPWPCRDELNGRLAREGADRILRQVEFEAEFPWLCPWCARFSSGDRAGERFKTERGLHAHMRGRRCANPAGWDLQRWVPTFDERLRIVGGFAPGISGAVVLRPGVDPVGFAERVRRAALGGCLPATRVELEA